MPSRPKVPCVCWDTCIIIDALQKKSDPNFQAIVAQISEFEAGRKQLIVSTISISEMHYVKGVSAEDSDRLITGFYDNEWVEPVTFDETIAQRARQLRRDHNINKYDAMIVATALERGATHLITRDGDGKANPNPLLKLDMRVGGSPPLRIMTPIDYQLATGAAQATVVAAPLFDPPIT